MTLAKLMLWEYHCPTCNYTYQSSRPQKEHTCRDCHGPLTVLDRKPAPLWTP